MEKIFAFLYVLIFASVLFAADGLAPSAQKSSAIKDPATGMEFVYVKGGCYQMGDVFGDKEFNDEKLVHEVCVDGFYMAKYDVTVGDFRKFVNDTGYATEAEKLGGCFVWTGSKWEKDGNKNWRNPGFSQDDRHPAVCVSWNDAVAFAGWQSRKSGMAFRLPTEAEWEYAAREGGRRVRFGVGTDTISCEIANFDARSQYKKPYSEAGQFRSGTMPAGSFKPNSLGLYDMSGNVWQWTNDWYGEQYYSESPKNNPGGPGKGQFRVLRGGSWSDCPRVVRAAFRFWNTPVYRFNFVGFRPVVSAP